MLHDDERRSKLLKLAIGAIIVTALLSQLLLQIGGGLRDEPLDFTEQLEQLEQPLIFEDGLPPFISSAGVYAPESIIFGIGFTISGILFILLAYEMAVCNSLKLSRHESTSLHIRSNNLGMLVGMFTGASLIIISWTPMHTQLIAHVALALQIFYGGMLWASLATISRSRIDSKKQFKNIPMNLLRWGLIAITFISLQLSGLAIANDSLNLAAAFEWVLFFSQVGVLASFQTIFDPNHSFEEE